jgi:hypothetical protein
VGPGAHDGWVPGKIEIGRGDEVMYGGGGYWRELPARYSSSVPSPTVLRARSLEVPQPNKIQSGQDRTLIFPGRTGKRRKANEGVALIPGGADTVNINGGTLQGFGTVTGNLVNGRTVHLGDGPGIFLAAGKKVRVRSCSNV